MNKILLLARTNIRKAKGQTVILALLFLISSMMLNIGLIVLFGFGSFFDKLGEELNVSDAFFFIPETLYTSEAEQYLSEKTDAFQKNNGVLAHMTLAWKGEPLMMNSIICSIDEPRSLSRVKLVGESLPETPDAIYVPYMHKVVGGYHLGDRLTAEIHGIPYEFTVAGFSENIFHDRMFMPDVAFVPAARYQELSEAFPEYRKVLVFANGVENYKTIESALLDLTGAEKSGYSGDAASLLSAVDFDRVKTNRTSMAGMMSAMMVIFTAVIVVICLLVIRFRISNSIEEDMPKIGSLQSVGYTSRQITLSVMAQYVVIALAACLAGVLPAYLALPFVGDVFAQQSGLLWEPGFAPALNLAAVGALTLIVAAVAFLVALKIRKISPVQALRGGILTHSFKRNHIPLEKSRLPLTAALSFKAVLQGIRQSVTVFIILTAVSFTAVIAAVLYYNAAIDLTAFEKVPGIERANAGIAFMPGEDIYALKDEIAAHKDVDRTQFMDMANALVGGIDVDVIVMTDFTKRATDNVYKGIPPRYDNEIAVSGLTADLLKKEIGDEVAVGREERPYLITGLIQGMEADAYITLDGMRKLDPGFQQAALMVYLRKGIDAADFVLEMEQTYEGRTYLVVDSDAGFAAGVSSFASIVSLVGLAILIVAGFVILLVLYFVIGSAIIRKRRELGIQKAIGYTTMNLMNQLSLGFAFPILLGACAGCLLGQTLINPLMSVGMSSMGIMKANYIIDTGWVAASGVCIVVLSYLTSLLITWRIRKISAYALVTE